jgi:hypothetical protein
MSSSELPGNRIDDALREALAASAREGQATKADEPTAARRAAQLAVWKEYESSILRPRQDRWDEAIAMLEETPVSAVGMRIRRSDSLTYFSRVGWKSTRLDERAGRDIRMTAALWREMGGIGDQSDNMAPEVADAIMYLGSGERMLGKPLLGRTPPVLGVRPRSEGDARLLARTEIAHRLSKAVLDSAVQLVGSVEYTELGMEETTNLFSFAVEKPCIVTEQATAYLQMDSPPEEDTYSYLHRMYIGPGIGEPYGRLGDVLDFMHTSQHVPLPECY